MKTFKHKYPFTLDGLKQKYGQTLQKQMLDDMNYSLSFFKHLEAITGKSIIKSITPTEDPFEFILELESRPITTGLTITVKRYGWFINQYRFSAGALYFDTYSSVDNGLKKLITNTYASEFEQCQDMIRRFDTTYYMSDSFSVVQQGDAAWNKIKELYTKCDKIEKAQLVELASNKGLTLA